MNSSPADVTTRLPLIMADDGATRTRRWKLHKQGDHSECKRGCGARRPLAAVPAAGVPGDARVDPAASLRALALRLEAAHEEDPGNALLARELRVTLQAIGAPEQGAGGELGAFLARIRG
jgi:hypothetical protein